MYANAKTYVDEEGEVGKRENQRFAVSSRTRHDSDARTIAAPTFGAE